MTACPLYLYASDTNTVALGRKIVPAEDSETLNRSKIFRAQWPYIVSVRPRILWFHSQFASSLSSF